MKKPSLYQRITSDEMALLADRHNNGNQAATRLLVEAVYHTLIAMKVKFAGHLKSIGTSTQEYEDFVDNYCEALLNRKKFNYAAGNNWNGYLYTIFKNYLLDTMDHYKSLKRGVERNSFSLDEAFGVCHLMDTGNDSSFSLPAARAIIVRFGNTRDVVCFDLIFSEGLAVKDVAVMLAVDAQVVYRSKKRIIQLLRHRKQLLSAN